MNLLCGKGFELRTNQEPKTTTKMKKLVISLAGKRSLRKLKCT